MEMESLAMDRRVIFRNPPEKPQALRIAVNKPKLALRHPVGVPVRSKNWSVSQKNPQKAVSILPTF